MKTLTENTKTAIMNRINAGENRFFVGQYYYEVDVSGYGENTNIHRIRRREQVAGRTPTSDWAVVLQDNEWVQ